jgi:hypothetical protein
MIEPARVSATAKATARSTHMRCESSSCTEDPGDVLCSPARWLLIRLAQPFAPLGAFGLIVDPGRPAPGWLNGPWFSADLPVSGGATSPRRPSRSDTESRSWLVISPGAKEFS